MPRNLPSSTHPNSLAIVIPALNEEEAIGATIERTLRVREAICKRTSLNEVKVIVVSDGSTDRTVDIARRYNDVELLVFEKNRGYGAAIKAGWEHAPADLLGFLDADGTCDPEFFVPMSQAVLEDGYDLVLGSRMGRDSHMPALRRIGNFLFALLLGYLSRKRVRDAASGMRILRRSALPELLPLPDGLHFTPAMSARAMMDEEIRTTEIEMAYAERVGRSKLRIVQDGLRFLSVILSAAAYIRVSRLTIPIVVLLVMACALLLVGPVLSYLHVRYLEEWMFYRLALSGMLGTMAVITLCATIVSEHVAALTLRRYERFGPKTRGLWRYETLRILLALGMVFGLVGIYLNWAGIAQLLTTGHVSLHWSRVLVGAFVGINFTLVAATLCTLKIVRALHQRQPFLDSAPGFRVQ